MYIANNILKFSAKADYQNGCAENTETSNDLGILITNKTLAGLLEDLKNLTGCNDILLNSHEEQGRIDLQGYETADGSTASASDMQLWKDGKIKLYSVTYTAYAYKAELSTLIEGF